MPLKPSKVSGLYNNNIVRGDEEKENGSMTQKAVGIDRRAFQLLTGTVSSGQNSNALLKVALDLAYSAATNSQRRRRPRNAALGSSETRKPSVGGKCVVEYIIGGPLLL
ncbi:hypothetical protein ED733_004668 [Metarhizium rileyi]|uniref:Uncharacterized protein n=1 Tax=Metarhizium rileyi (strain RCEF 4871) TaxID=1649241 RepID=A0A5C6G7Q0_METRR|nr:hypothetical protein ED733_004668 [Metarhizium rileyi]